MALYSSLGGAVMRAAASHAVDRSRESDLIADAAAKRKQAAIEQDMSCKEIAASMQELQGYYQLAMDGVGLAGACQKVGAAAKDLSAKEGTKGAPQTVAKGAEKQDAMTEQRSMVADNKSVARTADTAADRMTDKVSTQHKGENDEKAAKFREHLEKALKDNVTHGVSTALENIRSNVLEGGRRAKEDLKHAIELQTMVRDGDLAHMKSIDRIDRDMLREEVSRDADR